MHVSKQSFKFGSSVADSGYQRTSGNSQAMEHIPVGEW